MDVATRKRLAMFAKGLKGPIGQIPLDRAIRRDIGLFVDLRSAGATWSQIAQALMAVGVRRPDGGVVSSDHLRGAVSRQMKQPSMSPDVVMTTDTAPQVGRPYRPRHSVELNEKVPAMRDAVVKEANPSPSSGAQKRSPRQNANSILEKLARAKQLREI